MRAHLLSMSKMALAYACSHGFRVDVRQSPRPLGEKGRIGNVTHYCVAVHQCANVLPLEESDPTVLAKGNAIFNGPLKLWLDTTVWTACEVGLRYNAETDTATDGPRRGEPGYEDHGTDLPGTLDLVRVEETRIVLRDVKTGEPPKDREQLYAQAVAASRRWGKNEVEIGYTRALKTKVEELDVEVLDADRLDEEAGKIARVLRLLPTSTPVPGDDYCWKCDARPNCPAFGAVAAEAKLEDLEAAGFFA